MQPERKILICQVTRTNLFYNFVWPHKNRELNPGLKYYITAILFLATFALTLFSLYTHLYLMIHNNVDLPIMDNFSKCYSLLAIFYMGVIYVMRQPKIAKLLLDLSQFDKFGKPPNFEKINNKLNFMSKIASFIPALGVSSYGVMSLIDKANCERFNSENGISDQCGLILPYWIPLQINYFPIFHLICTVLWITAVLYSRIHLIIFFQVLEIVQHVILRINHLIEMFQNLFKHIDYNQNKKELVKCILYHQEILEMCERIDDNFSEIMFLHVVTTSVLCGCLEKEFVDEDYPVAVLVHLAAWIISLFIAAYGSQILLNASTNLSDAVWSCKWHEIDDKLKRDLLFVLMRSQKELQISVGPFGKLSYAFFVSVMKMSYSILTMLTA